MEEGILHPEYGVEKQHFEKAWFDYFKEGLPNILAFWGLAFALFLAAFFIPGQNFFFGALAMIFLGIPATSAYLSCDSFMKEAGKAIAGYERLGNDMHLTFHSGSDGFDCIIGKDFSHISWDSISKVKEKNGYFQFEAACGNFLIPGSAFKEGFHIEFMRMLLSEKLGSRAGLVK